MLHQPGGLDPGLGPPSPSPADAVASIWREGTLVGLLPLRVPWSQFSGGGGAAELCACISRWAFRDAAAA